VPGIYHVRLTVDGQAQSRDLKVIMDPRSGAPPEVLRQQLQMGQQAYAETLEARRALAEIGSVQKQLADVEQRLGEQNPTLKSASEDAQSEIAKILTDKRAAQQQPGGLQDGYSGLAAALRVIEGGDREAPSQAIALYKESSQRVKEGIAKWTTFKQMKLLQLNQKLREGKIDPVAISEIELEVQFLMSR
jgi:hypothetical protein